MLNGTPGEQDVTRGEKDTSPVWRSRWQPIHGSVDVREWLVTR